MMPTRPERARTASELMEGACRPCVHEHARGLWPSSSSLAFVAGGHGTSVSGPLKMTVCVWRLDSGVSG